MDGWIDGWLTLAGRQSVIQSSQPVSHSGSLYVSPSVCLSVFAIGPFRAAVRHVTPLKVCLSIRATIIHYIKERERERIEDPIWLASLEDYKCLSYDL